MMVMVSIDNRVPAEFVGKARHFRTSMHAEAAPVGCQMHAVCKYAFDLYKRRNTGPRPEHLITIEQQWRSIWDAGQLRLSIHRDKRSMLIQDTRIVTTISSNTQWDGGSEKSISLVESSLELTKHHAETTATMLAAVSLHALGRWYQRALTTDYAALMIDLALIATSVPNMAARALNVQVNSGNGGFWRGMMTQASDGKPVVNVRTFI